MQSRKKPIDINPARLQVAVFLHGFIDLALHPRHEAVQVPIEQVLDLFGEEAPDARFKIAPIARQDFVDLLAELHKELNFTAVMVTHDLDILRDLCTKVAVLADHQLVAFGTLETVLACQHGFVKQFFHNKRAERVFRYG